MSSIPLGGKPYPYPARLDDQQHRRFRSLYGARAVPKRRSIVLRLKRPFQQHDFVRPKEAEKPQRLDTRHTGQRQKFFCKTRNHKRFLITADDIIICDPEAEYYPLVGRLKGQVIKVSQNSTQYINPMDINLNYSEGDTPIALKSDFILSFCELIMGGKNGLEAVEKTLIDRAVISVYRNYLADPKPENMPIWATSTTKSRSSRKRKRSVSRRHWNSM